MHGVVWASDLVTQEPVNLLFMAQPGELWFGKIMRDVITRGVFTSVADLEKKLMRYIRQTTRRREP